jgi:hypothetical protein
MKKDHDRLNNSLVISQKHKYRAIYVLCQIEVRRRGSYSLDRNRNEIVQCEFLSYKDTFSLIIFRFSSAHSKQQVVDSILVKSYSYYCKSHEHSLNFRFFRRKTRTRTEKSKSV